MEGTKLVVERFGWRQRDGSPHRRDGCSWEKAPRHSLRGRLEKRCLDKWSFVSSQQISSTRGDERVLRGDLVFYDARHELTTGHGLTLS